MTSWANKVKAGMHPQIDFVYPSGLLLLEHIRFVLIVEKFYNWHPGVAVVDVVSESGRINDRKAD